MSTSENKTSRRITFIDIVLIIAILAAITFIVYEFIIPASEKADSDGKEVEFTLFVEKVKYHDFGIELLEDQAIKCDFLQKGESVYLSDGSVEIGSVVDVKYEPYLESTGIVNESGELIYEEYDGYVNLIITVKAVAEQKNGAVEINGCVLLSGNELEFRTPTYTSVGVIGAITDKEVKKQ